MFLFTSSAYRLPVLGVFTLIACVAHAQTAAPAPSTPSTPSPPYSSVFEGYKPYTDDPIANWKAANEEVARIGGWREYARQAQGLDSKPENMPGTKADESIPKAKP